jgi:O-antigen ligase
MRSATGAWLLAVLFTAVVGWTVLWARFQDADPLKGRREIMAGSVAMVRAKPLFGFGLGNYQEAFPKYSTAELGTVVNAAHDDWVQWAVDGGIPFSLLMVCIAVWSLPKAVGTLWGIGILAVFAHSFVDFPLQNPIMEAWLFVLLGALAAERTPRRES